MDGHEGSVWCLAISKNNLISGSRDETIKIWDTTNGTLINSYSGLHSNEIVALVNLKDSEIASGSRDGSIKIWKEETGEVRLTITGHSSEVLALATLESGEIVSGSRDETIKIWN